MLDILDEVGYFKVKFIISPADLNVQLDSEHGDLLYNPA